MCVGGAGVCAGGGGLAKGLQAAPVSAIVSLLGSRRCWHLAASSWLTLFVCWTVPCLRELVAQAGGALLEVSVGTKEEWHREDHPVRWVPDTAAQHSTGPPPPWGTDRQSRLGQGLHSHALRPPVPPATLCHPADVVRSSKGQASWLLLKQSVARVSAVPLEAVHHCRLRHTRPLPPALVHVCGWCVDFSRTRACCPAPQGGS